MGMREKGGRMIGDARETYSDSTLYSFKKSTLIEIIRCLERNLKSANETIDIQTTQCEKLIDSTKKAYYEKGKTDGFHQGVLAQTKEQLPLIAQTEKDIRADERAKVIEEIRERSIIFDGGRTIRKRYQDYFYDKGKV